MTETITSKTPQELEAQQQIVDKAMADVSHIATLPEITLQIIKIVEDPDSTANDLHKIISNDPALCARVLKVVNSAFYGLPGQIGSINRAIVLLGLNAVKNVAIAASLAKLFRGGQLCPEFSAKELWKHSLSVAAGVKLISDKAAIDTPDEAFLVGLVHDIGIMVEMQAMRTKLIEVFEYRAANSVTFLEAERQIIGATHQEFGSALCEKWKFPSTFSSVTGYHHNPTELGKELRTLTNIVHVADWMSAKLELGFNDDDQRGELDPTILEEIKLTPEALNQVLEELPEATELAEHQLSGSD